MSTTAAVVGALLFAFAVGSVPFSQLVAHRLGGIDLRQVGTGTVSGSGVGEAVGFRPMVVAGLADVGKGAVAVLPAAGVRPLLAAAAAGAAVIGHNWSPWLRGAGGRGIGPAMGSCSVLAWPGTVLFLAGLGLGKLLRETSAGSFVAQAALAPLLWFTHDGAGLVLGCALVMPMWIKRVVGNHLPANPTAGVYWYRLLRDSDPEPKPGSGS